MTASPFLPVEPLNDLIRPDFSPVKPESRFYVNIPSEQGEDLSKEPVARLLGCRVLLLRAIKGDRQGQAISSIPGFILPDTYQHGYNTFTCLAVGPGEWVKCKKKRLWIEPEVRPGDYCVSQHWTQTTMHPHWHPPVYLDEVDGRGRVILDCRFVEFVFNP
jgi:co-chaperonin GroES (HSP10)